MKVADSLKTLSEQLDTLKNSVNALIKTKATEDNTFVEVDKESDNIELLTEEYWFLAIKEKDIDAINVFIKHKFDVNVKGMQARTALIIVSYNGHTEIVKLLLDAGADMTIEDDDGTALINALLNSHTDIIKLLIDAGADINAKSIKYGSTSLIIASKNGNTDIAKLLIDAGADINTKDKAGNTALYWAKYNCCADITRLLKDAGSIGVKNILDKIKMIK